MTLRSIVRGCALAAALWTAGSHDRRAVADIRVFICFDFELDSADLPPGCSETLAEFASYWQDSLAGRLAPATAERAEPFPARAWRVEIVGRSGGERDGNNLAFLRAARVARELARLGVPASVIELKGSSDRELVDASNPRSGANRRVGINRI